MKIDSKGNQEKAFFGGGLHLLNTTIVPPGASGVWVVEDVDTVWATHLVAYAVHWSAPPDSHIGHDATAQIASELLKTGVQVDRTPWDGRGLGLALQLKGRPEEGRVLNRDEMEALGYSWRILYRVNPNDGLPVHHHRRGSSPEATSARDFLRSNLSASFLFLWTGETRTGTHSYVRVIMHSPAEAHLIPSSPAPIDVTPQVLAVLSDPVLPLPNLIKDRGGYSGSRNEGFGHEVMVFTGRRDEDPPADVKSEVIASLAGDIVAALGLPDAVSLSWSIA